MKLSASLAILFDIGAAFGSALLPTLSAIFHRPSLLLHPAALSRIVMAHVWTMMSNTVDQKARPVKDRLITENAYGLVLDLGAGEFSRVNSFFKNKNSLLK